MYPDNFMQDMLFTVLLLYRLYDFIGCNCHTANYVYVDSTVWDIDNGK